MKYLFALLSVFCLLFSANAQSIAELRDQKSRTVKQINYTSKLIRTTAKNAKQSVNRLTILRTQIELRKKLVADLESELKIIDQMIINNTFMVDALRNDLIEIRSEYASLIRQAQKNRNVYNKWLFILSAESFNQAYKRFVYIKQYTSIRKRQIEQISAVNDVLSKRLNQLEAQQNHKTKLFEQTKEEQLKLANERQEQTQLLSKLTKKQRELKRELSKQRRTAKRLEKEIEKLIEEAAKKAKAKGRKQLTPQEQLLAGNFQKNKGRLPWPVTKGIIVDKFGEHPHPVLKYVKIKNNGIDIATEQSQPVRSIFEGVVSRVIAIPGANIAVIIQHGSYLTVYSNLINVNVKKGDKVATKQNIGTVFTDKADNGKSILKFQVWENSTKQNPEKWLAK